MSKKYLGPQAHPNVSSNRSLSSYHCGQQPLFLAMCAQAAADYCRIRDQNLNVLAFKPPWKPLP